MKFYALFVHAGNTKLVGQCKKKMMYKLINIRCLFTEFVVSFFLIFVGDTLLWVRTPLTRGVLDTTLCDKVCQWLATGQCFSPATPVSSINKTDRHDITEISLKVVLNSINQPLTSNSILYGVMSGNILFIIWSVENMNPDVTPKQDVFIC